MAKLTARQQAFLREYFKDNNATQAAIRAGYAPKSAAVEGVRLLRNANISRVIEERRAELSAAAHVDATYVLSNLKEVVERCMQAKPVMIFDPVEKCMVQATEEVIGADGEYREVGVYQFDSRGANTALQALGKHIGMFVDKVDLNHKGAVKVVHNVPRPEPKRDSS